MEWQSIIFSLVPVVLGVGLVWGRVSKLLIALKELADVLTVIVESFQDKQLTKEETDRIKKEVGEALAAFKAIVK